VNTPARAWLLRDGAWRAGENLPPTDRAARYGMAVFATLGVRDGKMLFRDEHLRLLAEAARELLAVAPVIPEVPLAGDDRGTLRLYVTAGDGGPASPVTAPRVFALFEPGAGPWPDHQTARLHAEPAAPFGRGAKTANYWMNCAAQAAAQADGFDHALLADHSGRLLSAAMGNLFFVLDGRLCTPAATLPIRPGVMRAWVMGRMETHETEAPAAVLAQAEEIFLTNSRLGVMPLQVGAVAPGPVGCALRDACRAAAITP
jgi:branched-subunit amino acid aminotransferase/4-amino-4-deoxychorismate lyase